MKKRGRPPRNCAIEKTRHENDAIGKIEPEASREDGETSETPSVRVSINGRQPEEYGVSVNYDLDSGVITTHPVEAESPSWESFKRDIMEALDSQCVPYGSAASGASKPMLAEADITDEMVRMVTLALGGIAPNAWGLTDPKRIIAAVCNAVGRGWR